jgi:hypothetical protein
MKTHRSLHLLIAAFMLAFGIQAHAQRPREHAVLASPRDELAHAYVLLKLANHNYGGHKGAAIKELEAAGHELGLDLKARGSEHERQMKSDELLAEAGRILHETRDRLDAHDRERAAAHVNEAIHQVDMALRVK